MSVTDPCPFSPAEGAPWSPHDHLDSGAPPSLVLIARDNIILCVWLILCGCVEVLSSSQRRINEPLPQPLLLIFLSPITTKVIEQEPRKNGQKRTSKSDIINRTRAVAGLVVAQPHGRQRPGQSHQRYLLLRRLLVLVQRLPERKLLLFVSRQPSSPLSAPSPLPWPPSSNGFRSQSQSQIPRTALFGRLVVLVGL